MADTASGADLPPVVNPTDAGPIPTTTTSPPNATTSGPSMAGDSAHATDTNDTSDLFIPYERDPTTEPEVDQNVDTPSSTRGNQSSGNMWAKYGEAAFKPFAGDPEVKIEEDGVGSLPIIDFTGQVDKSGRGKKRKSTTELHSKRPRPRAGQQFRERHNAKLAARLVDKNDFFANIQKSKDAPDQREFGTASRLSDVWALLKKNQIFKTLDDERRFNIDIQTLRDALKRLGAPLIKPAEDGTWKAPGMRSTLRHHQIIGVAFMVDLEISPKPPYGGSLNDDMGTGKTVMACFLIVRGKSHRRLDDICPPKMPRSRATLVVCPASIIDQWYNEIRVHCKTDISSGNGKPPVIGTWIKYSTKGHDGYDSLMILLQNCDIVITSYTQVALSFPVLSAPADVSDPFERQAIEEEAFEYHKGALHRVHFHRIILDEAQYIRNPQSLTSQACCALSSDFRWTLTGTPMFNGADDPYALLKFIEAPMPFKSHQEFREGLTLRHTDESVSAYNTIIEPCMIRRQHGDVFLNAQIVSLPKSDGKVLRVDFNPFERMAYEIVEKRFLKIIVDLLFQGERGRARGQAFAMMTYLRQMTAHPFMPQSKIYDLLHRQDLLRLGELVKKFAGQTNEEEAGKATILHIKRALESKAAQRNAEGRQVVDLTQHARPSKVSSNGSDNTGKEYGLSYKPQRYLRKIKEHRDKLANADLQCVVCANTADSPHKTSCDHIYCEDCLKDLQQDAALEGKDCCPCKQCGAIFSSVDAIRPDEMEELARRKVTGRKNDGKSSLGEADWVEKGKILPSSKGLAVKAQVLSWLEDDPRQSIIIYTQWTAMVKILANICSLEGWKYYTFTGSMSKETRANQIKRFEETGQILISGLKVGSLGLNLTMASRVINVDPWWNNATEQQAFARVHRMGQKNETAFLQLSVLNTIDDRMAAVKTRKQREIDRFSGLGDEDIVELFGGKGKLKNGVINLEESDDDEQRESESESEDEDEEE